jgi:hypothetical protein
VRAAGVAAPGLAALDYRYHGDQQAHQRIEPPSSHECVAQQPDQQGGGEVGAEQVLLPSLAVADEPILLPMRCLARPSNGIRTKLLAASAIPTMLSSACVPFASVRIDSNATYGASRKNCTATSFCARSSAWCESVRQPVKRQTITTLARPSIALSMPNPIKAIDPATTPATIATMPSTAMYAKLTQESSLARRASLRYSVDAGAICAASTSQTIRRDAARRGRFGRYSLAAQPLFAPRGASDVRALFRSR